MTESVRVMIEELRLQNFRAFTNARLELSDLTFLVGRNGAGKSSLLDAMDLLREAVSDSLENALDRRGGLQTVRSAQATRRRQLPMGIAIVLRIEFPGNQRTQAVYGFEVHGKRDRTSLQIRECLASSKGTSFERMNQTFQSVERPDVSPPVSNLVLPLVGRSDSLWELILNATRKIRAYELSPAHMAAAPEIGDRSTLDRAGVNAGDVLKAVEGTSAHQWVVDRLGTIAEGITNVRARSLVRPKGAEIRSEVSGPRAEV